MNERIVELIKEADRRCSETRGVYDEILAQLIVHECTKLNKQQSYELMGVLADIEEGDGFDDVCLHTLNRIQHYLSGNTLLEHFGIEI